MINNQLLDYIKQELSLNISKDIIITNLKSQGWTDVDLNEAFATLFIVQQTPIVPTLQDIASLQQVQQNKKQTIINFKNYFFSFFSKNRKIFFIVVVLLFMGLISFGAYGYYSGMFISLPNLTSKAIDNIKNTNSATYDTTISIDFSEVKNFTDDISQFISETVIPTKLSFTTKGAYDFLDVKNKKMSALISVNAGLFIVEADIRMINNTFYAQLIKAPKIAFLSFLAEIENKWVSLLLEPGDNLPVDSSSSLVNPVAGIFGIDSSILEKITEEQKEQLYQITRNAHFVKMVQRFSPEVINDNLSYHFLFDIDREGINAYFQSLKEYINTIGKNDSSLSAFDPTSFSKDLENMEDFKGEIWIGRKDTLPYKILLDFAIKPDEAKEEKVKVNIISIFGSWNQPVVISAPTESTSLEEVISSAMGGSIEQAKENSMEVSIKASLAGLRAEAEVFYDKGNSYLGFCSSLKVKDARKNIENNKGTDFICKNKPEAYAIGVKLPQNAGYWCVDSIGSSKATTMLSSSTICPIK
jgi:hypothetical protein